MRRDFPSKKYLDRQRVSSPRRRAPVLLFGAAILLASAGLIGYQYKKHPENFPVASANFSRLADWLSHKKKVEQAEEKNKEVVVSAAPVEKQIHFEFYTALPNMRVKVPTPVESKPVVTAKVEKPIPKAKAPVVEADASEAPKAGLINHEALERDFATAFNNQPYVVQLGVFGNIETANGYKQSLHRAGFNVDVVKVAANGKTAYRVQFGPYSNKDEARIMQKQLLKKNVSALVRKAVALQ